MKTEPLNIVLVEDDEGHAELIRINLERANVINDIVHLTDGRAALDYIQRQGVHADRPQSAMLILLDINMPVLDGIETLRQLKADPKTAKIPVVMLTTTDNPQEIERCYALGCNVYITKPVEYDRFCEALHELGVFLQFVRVPHESE